MLKEFRTYYLIATPKNKRHTNYGGYNFLRYKDFIPQASLSRSAPDVAYTSWGEALEALAKIKNKKVFKEAFLEIRVAEYRLTLNKP